MFTYGLSVHCYTKYKDLLARSKVILLFYSFTSFLSIKKETKKGFLKQKYLKKSVNKKVFLNWKMKTD